MRLPCLGPSHRFKMIEVAADCGQETPASRLRHGKPQGAGAVDQLNQPVGTKRLGIEHFLLLLEYFIEPLAVDQPVAET